MLESSKFVIAVTAYNRPELLDALLKCLTGVRGIGHWSVRIAVDPSDKLEANLAVLGGYRNRLALDHAVNEQNKGIRKNPYDNIQAAFDAGAEVVLLLEDDLTIGKDALELCRLLADGPLYEDWVMCANLLLTTCMSESIYDPITEQDCLALAALVVSTRFFSSYGLLVSRRQWQDYFVPNWFVDEPRMDDWLGNAAVGWDVAMNRLLLLNPELRVLQSLVPRVNHHGKLGTHVGPEFQSRSFDNIKLERYLLPVIAGIEVVDPLRDLQRIPSSGARLYLNLCRQLWTLQQSALLFKHRASDFIGKKSYKFKLFSSEYLIVRRRKRR